jgi:hypothetical protein
MDNQVFNVNGKTDDRESLHRLLNLRVKQHCFSNNRIISGYSIHKDHGLILYSSEPSNPDGYVRFPNRLTVEEVMPIVNGFLNNKELTNSLSDWDVNPKDSDVDCYAGWRIYCEDWGHIDGGWSGFVAIKKVWLWYGK